MSVAITHTDGTVYHVERRGSGRIFDTYFVSWISREHCKHQRVYANSTEEAITKARAQYAKFLL